MDHTDGLSRRDAAVALTALFGLSALNACVQEGSEAEMERVGETAAELTGTTLSWVDTFAELRAIHGNTTGPKAVILRGHSTIGDGGGGIFVWDGASHAGDNGGTIAVPTASTTGRWVRVFDGPLHVRWFGAKFNGVTNDAAAIQAALQAAAASFAGGPDVGGGYGGVVVAPKGTAVVGSKLKVPNGVRFVGQGPHSTVLRLSPTFPATSHFIELGDVAPSAANFDTRVQDMQLFADIVSGNAGTAMVFTNGAQHTSGLKRVKIFAGARHAVRIEIGTGGASYIEFDNVETFNKYAYAKNAQWHINYAGPQIVKMRNIVAQGPANSDAGADSVCVHLRGGVVMIDGFHCEGIARAIVVEQSSSNALRVSIHGATGNPYVQDLVRIASTQDRQTVLAMLLDPAGGVNTVNNLRDNTTLTRQLVQFFTF